MTWTTIIIGGGLVIGLLVLLTGSQTVSATVGFDPSQVTVTPSATTGTTNASQGTP